MGKKSDVVIDKSNQNSLQELQEKRGRQGRDSWEKTRAKRRGPPTKKNATVVHFLREKMTTKHSEKKKKIQLTRRNELLKIDKKVEPLDSTGEI